MFVHFVYLFPHLNIFYLYIFPITIFGITVAGQFNIIHIITKLLVFTLLLFPYISYSLLSFFLFVIITQNERCQPNSSNESCRKKMARVSSVLPLRICV